MIRAFLLGVCLAIATVTSGLWVTFGHPGAMLDALLAPFSGERWRRHIRYKVNRYYQRLTKGRLLSQLRSDLLTDYGNDILVTELRQALKKKGSLYRTFDKFSVNYGKAGKVWTKNQFSAFVSSRLGEDPGTAHVLWRCFCYNATYPFADLPRQPEEEQQLNLDAWVQAIALLATDADCGVGRNMAQLSLYDGRSKECIWHRFFSFSIPSSRDGRSDDGNMAVQTDEWLPPDMLDNVARVAATQLPVDIPMRGPPLSAIRPNVRKLAEDVSNSNSSCASITTRDFVIPYQDVLNLLCAVLRVSKADKSSRFISDQLGLRFSVDVDSCAHQAVAKGILDVGGIHDDSAVSFADYSAFSDKFYSYDDAWGDWSFDQELRLLWRGLFSVSQSNGKVLTSAASLYNSNNNENNQHPPPPLILQAFDFLYPFPQHFFGRHRHRQETLVYSSDPVSGLLRDGVLRALTWPYSSKLVVIYGHVTAGNAATISSQGGARRTPSSTRNTKENGGQSAIFAIETSSPLWCTYTTGAVDDFLVDDMHLLFEITPRPRILRYNSAAEKTRFVDLVNTSGGSAVMSFGQRQQQSQQSANLTGTDQTSTGSAARIPSSSSGLTLDLGAGVATLSSMPEGQAGERGQGYVEIQVGPHGAPPKRMGTLEAWITSMHIQKLEVYSGPDGVPVGLSIERGSRRNNQS